MITSLVALIQKNIITHISFDSDIHQSNLQYLGLVT